MKRVTPLGGRDLEDALRDTKEEMREYIEELFRKMEMENKKKMMDLESQIKREAKSNQSPTATGHGRS